MSRFDWVSDSCRLLWHTAAEFDRTQPFKGLRIGTGIHLEPKTAALLLTLQRGGAEVVSTGNLNSTQAETVDYLREHGIDGRRWPDRRPGRAGPQPARRPGDRAEPHPRQRRRPVRALPRGAVRRADRRYRGDDVGPRPAPAAARPDREAADRHQRQPHQAVRREHARGRPGHGRGVHADHEPHHQRPARDRLRLRLGGPRRRDVLPQLLLGGVGRGAAAGPPAARGPRRHRSAGPGGGHPDGGRHRDRHRGARHRHRRRPAPVQGRRDHDELRAISPGRSTSRACAPTRP